jgi:hypothetical protein
MGWREWLKFLIPARAPAPAPAPVPVGVTVRVRVDGLGDVVPDGCIRLDDQAATRITGRWADGQFTFPLPPGTPPHGATLVVQAPGYLGAEPRFTIGTGPTQELPPVRLDRMLVAPPAAPPPPEPVPAPAPGPSGDAIVLSTAQIGAADCPDVRQWPVFATLRRVTLADREDAFERGDTMPEFEGRDQLRPANGTQGAISYTLWLGCRIRDVWHLYPIVECIGGYVPTGQLLRPGHVGPNLLYDAEGPLKRYQPQPGEEVVMFCTTGDTRRQNAQWDGKDVIGQRTTVLKVKWQVGVTTA